MYQDEDKDPNDQDDMDAKLAALDEMKQHIGVVDDEDHSPDLYTGDDANSEVSNYRNRKKKGGGMKMPGGGHGGGGMDMGSIMGMMGGGG